MLVRTVAGVDHAGFQSICQKLRRACRTVAQDDDVGFQRLQITRGVLERFAFGQARSGCRDIDHIGAQPERGQLERGARPRARFDKEVHQRFTAKRGDFFDFARADLLECIRCLKNEIDFLCRQLAQPE
jgi:hypothetical protein